jgi:hypothetical protein
VRLLVQLFLHVCFIAEHLAPLQGKCIPALLGYGLWHEDTTFFVATSVVEGEHPGHSTYGASEAAVKVGFFICLFETGGMGVQSSFACPWYAACLNRLAVASVHNS